MKPDRFVELVVDDQTCSSGTETLKKTVARFSVSQGEGVAVKAHHDWNNHRDYNKYTPQMHTVLCCGWTDWVDHRDS